VLILKESEGLFPYYTMFIVPIGSLLPVTLPTYLNYIPTSITSTLMMAAGSTALHSPISCCAIISQLPQKLKISNALLLPVCISFCN
jgi:hypothetical protein